jgi:hypothetical protein
VQALIRRAIRQAGAALHDDVGRNRGAASFNVGLFLYLCRIDRSAGLHRENREREWPAISPRSTEFNTAVGGGGSSLLVRDCHPKHALLQGNSWRHEDADQKGRA